MISAGLVKSQAGLPLLCNGAIRRRMKSAPIISRVSPARVSRRILVVATVSLPLATSTLLQSLPWTGDTRRTLQNSGGSSSSIQHHRPRHSSHLSFTAPSGYAPLDLGIQATHLETAPPGWMRGEK